MPPSEAVIPTPRCDWCGRLGALRSLFAGQLAPREAAWTAMCPDRRVRASGAPAGSEVSGGRRGVQAQAGEAAGEVQRAWRKHEAVRAELSEARTCWAAERRDLQAQVPPVPSWDSGAFRGPCCRPYVHTMLSGQRGSGVIGAETTAAGPVGPKPNKALHK